MRRGLASLIIGLSLVVATLSWAGFTLSRTILDPGRSERLAEQLLDNERVRAALVDRLADAVETQIPDDVTVPRTLIEAGAETALDDPRVRALIVDGVVQYHRNALEGNAEPVVVDAGALGTVSREVLVNVRPELDQVMPVAPAIELELPTTGLNWLGRVKRIVDRFTVLGALVAAGGATMALAVARDRGVVLRRVAFWGYGAAAFWMVVGFAIPWLADLLSPTSGAITSAAVDVFFGAMIGPAIILAGASTAILILGFALPGIGRRRGARAIRPPRKAAGSEPGAAPARTTAPPPTPLVTRTGPAPVPAQRVSPSPTQMFQPAMDQTSQMPRPVPTSSIPPAPTPQPAPTQTSAPPPTTVAPPTTAESARTIEMPPRSALDASETLEHPPPGAPTWEEGIGYFDEDPTTEV